MLDVFLQLMSIVPVLVIVIGSYLIVRQQGFDRGVSVSVHAGLNSKTSFILTLLILICGTLYYLALWLWVAPKYQLPYMNVFIPLGFLGAYTLGLFPADRRKKWSSRLHTSAGVLLIILMYSYILLVVASPLHTHPFSISVSWMFLVVGAVLAMIRLFPTRLKREVLTLEVLYVGLFYSVIIALTFL